MAKKLAHYLKLERRRAGLCQQDIAALLGVRAVSKVSRYELGRFLPPLRTALLYEVIFGKPVAELFAGTFETVRAEVARRALKHQAELERRSPARGHRKRSIKNLTFFA